MKKLITLIAAFFCFAFVAFAQDYTDVTLHEQIPNGSIIPRSQNAIPIACCVISNTIFVSFSEDIGEVEVTLEEVSNGIIFQTFVDSSDHSAILPFSGASGEYTITFSLSSGVVYCGIYEL